MTKVLKLALLGPLSLKQDDTPLTNLDSGKAQALLCYLALNGRIHSRHALANLLWGELPESDARRNLRGVVMKLRQAAAPHLEITHQTLAFNAEAPYWLDCEAFQTAIHGSPDLGQLEKAVGMVRGEFMAEFYVRQAPDFEEWLQQQRAYWRRQAILAHHKLVGAYAETAAYAAGIDVARRLVLLDPVREASHRQLMELLALSGQRAAALTQFEQCRAILADELGVDVSAETSVLAQQIRSGEFSREGYTSPKRPLAEHRSSKRPSPPPPVTAAPPPFIAGPPITHPTRFFGRERELKRLFNLLRQRPLQNAAIIGPRRCGKTSLLHYMRQITTTPPAQLRPTQTANWLPQPGRYQWIFVDFQDPRLGSREALLTTLLQQMGLELPQPVDLDHFLDVVSEELQRPTVVMFDEIGVALTRYPELDDAFWESLRSLATNQVEGNLGFVLASAKPPSDLARHTGFGSPFFNIFGYTVVLGPLSETAARELIASSPIPFAEADVEWILAESGRWPLLLQILCRERLLTLEEGETDERWREDGRRQMAPFIDLKNG